MIKPSIFCPKIYLIYMNLDYYLTCKIWEFKNMGTWRILDLCKRSWISFKQSEQSSFILRLYYLIYYYPLEIGRYSTFIWWEGFQLPIAAQQPTAKHSSWRQQLSVIWITKPQIGQDLGKGPYSVSEGGLPGGWGSNSKIQSHLASKWVLIVGC